MRIDEVRAWARMMREEGIASLAADGLSIVLGSQPTLQDYQTEKPDLDALFAGIPDDPLKDPATYIGGGIPSFLPISKPDAE